MGLPAYVVKIEAWEYCGPRTSCSNQLDLPRQLLPVHAAMLPRYCAEPTVLQNKKLLHIVPSVSLWPDDPNVKYKSEYMSGKAGLMFCVWTHST